MCFPFTTVCIFEFHHQRRGRGGLGHSALTRAGGCAVRQLDHASGRRRPAGLVACVTKVTCGANHNQKEKIGIENFGRNARLHSHWDQQMRKFELAMGTLSAIVSAGSAIAADMLLKASPPPPQVLSWTGWYVGLNAGYNWGDGSVSSTAIPTGGLVPGIATGSHRLAPTISIPAAMASSVAARSAIIGNLTTGDRHRGGHPRPRPQR